MVRIELGILGLVFASSAWACDPQTGERVQNVVADWNGDHLARWTTDSAEPEVLDLPNGLKVGIRIEEATPEKYAELKSSMAHVTELVSIVLYDMESTPPRELSQTWGGANSIQGFGSQGGANRVEALGDPGLELHLMKPVCSE